MRSDAVRKRWYRAAALAALLMLISGCVRPQGQPALQTTQPPPTPVAGHGPLTITGANMHDGEVGVAFAPITLAATGGVEPYHWTVSVGALPGGLTLSAAGVISGTPAANGFFQFSVQVFDADSDTAGLPRTIGIVPRLAATLVPACATECSVELGCATVCGTFGQVAGGASPLTYKLTNGVLPSGTSLSGMTLKGTFTGLPGRLSFTAQVTDGFGATASLTPTFNLFPHISLSPGGTCSYVRQLSCTVSLKYSGGPPNGSVAFKVVGWLGNLKCGSVAVIICPEPPISATAGGGTLVVTVGPVSANTFPRPTGTFTVSITDQSSCGAGTHCSSGSVSIPVA